MSESERAQLASEAAGPRVGCADRCVYAIILFGGLPVLGLLVGAAVGGTLEKLVGGHLPGGFALAILRTGTLMGLAVAAFVRVEFFLRMRARRKLCEIDLSRGEVEVLDCTAEDAVLIERHEEAEGRAYIVSLGGGKVVYLIRNDDDLSDEELESGDTLPNRSFSIVRAPASGEVLSIEARGERLSPSRKVDATKLSELPQNGALLGGTIDEVLSQLGAPVSGAPPRGRAPGDL